MSDDDYTLDDFLTDLFILSHFASRAREQVREDPNVLGYFMTSGPFGSEQYEGPTESELICEQIWNIS